MFLGGFLLIIATGRHIALFGALLAALAGAWFTLGTMLSPLWSTPRHPGRDAGHHACMRIMEQLGFFSGLGAVIIFFAAAAIGRIAAVSPGLRQVETVPATTRPRRVPTEVTRPAPGPSRRREPPATHRGPTRRPSGRIPSGPGRAQATIIGWHGTSCQPVMR